MAKNKVQLILEEPGVRLDLARGLMRDKLIRSYKVPDDIISLDMMDKEACFRCFEWVTKNIFGKEWEWDYSNGDLYEGMYIREFGEMQDEWIQKKGKGE